MGIARGASADCARGGLLFVAKIRPSVLRSLPSFSFSHIPLPSQPIPTLDDSLPHSFSLPSVPRARIRTMLVSTPLLLLSATTLALADSHNTPRSQAIKHRGLGAVEQEGLMPRVIGMARKLKRDDAEKPAKRGYG